MSASALVIAWMLHSQRFPDRPQIIPLFGTGSVEHLSDNLRATEIRLTNEEVNLLNEA